MLNNLRTRWSSPTDQLSLATLIVMAGVIVFADCHPAWAAAHYFHPAKDALWKGLLAQLVHFNTLHASLNLAGLLTVSTAAGFIGKIQRVVLALITSGIAVGIGLQQASPPIAWYIGLSGALYGAWVWLSLELAAHRLASPVLKGLAGLAAVAIGCKAAAGFATPAMLGAMPIAYQAHLYGYAGGLVFFAACLCTRLYCKRCTRPRKA